MTVQTELDLGNAAKERAIARVETAHAAWVQLGIDTLRTLILSKPEFTSDDLWPLLPRVSEPRAMGAVLRRAQQEGLIRPTSTWRLSRRAKCHRRPLRVWTAM